MVSHFETINRQSYKNLDNHTKIHQMTAEVNTGTGVVTRQLRAPLLAEDRGSVPSTHSRGSKPPAT